MINKTYNLRGCLLGVCWRSLPGGGFLVSRSWTFSGPNVIYLYPDCRFFIYNSYHITETAFKQSTYYELQLWLTFSKILIFYCTMGTYVAFDFSFSKDGSGGIFPKLWCRTGQTLRSQRLHGGRSGSGKFVLLGSSFCFGGHKIMDHLVWLLLYLQVKVPLMSEPQGDWFTSQPASPACFCRFLIKVNPKIWKTLSTLMVS